MATFAVLFDMDGLMLDTERMARKAWTRALAEQGYQLDEVNYLRLVGRTVIDAERILTELFGPELPFEDVFKNRQAYYEADIDSNGIPVKDGLFELLGFLESSGVVKAVASSTPSWFATHKLARTGIAPHFSTIVCGDQVRHGKPAPDIFLEAARKISYPPECCVVLEDSEAGIRGAYDAGALPIMVPDLKPASPEIVAIAYGIYPSLREVLPVLEGFVAGGLPHISKR